MTPGPTRGEGREPSRYPGKGAVGTGNKSVKALRLGHAWGAGGTAEGQGTEAEGAQGEREERRAKRGKLIRASWGSTPRKMGSHGRL